MKITLFFVLQSFFSILSFCTQFIVNMGSKQASVQQFVDDKISSNKVMIFSKTYCPYCKMAKDTFAKTNTEYEVIELDERNDGNAIQDYLQSKTGARSVPRVFIHGKCIGGGSETKNMHQQGKLIPLIKGN